MICDIAFIVIVTVILMSVRALLPYIVQVQLLKSSQHSREGALHEVSNTLHQLCTVVGALPSAQVIERSGDIKHAAEQLVNRLSAAYSKAKDALRVPVRLGWEYTRDADALRLSDICSGDPKEHLNPLALESLEDRLTALRDRLSLLLDTALLPLSATRAGYQTGYTAELDGGAGMLAERQQVQGALDAVRDSVHELSTVCSILPAPQVLLADRQEQNTTRLPAAAFTVSDDSDVDQLLAQWPQSDALRSFEAWIAEKRFTVKSAEKVLAVIRRQFVADQLMVMGLQPIILLMF